MQSVPDIPLGHQRKQFVPVEELIDVDESLQHRGRGRPPIPLLRKLAQACYHESPSSCHDSGNDRSSSDSASNSETEDGQKIRYRCLGVTKGGGRCPTSWGSCTQGCILKHAKDCQNLMPELCASAAEACAGKSVVLFLEKETEQKEESNQKPKRIHLDVARKIDGNQSKLDGIVTAAGSRTELQNKLDGTGAILILYPYGDGVKMGTSLLVPTPR